MMRKTIGLNIKTGDNSRVKKKLTLLVISISFLLAASFIAYSTLNVPAKVDDNDDRSRGVGFYEFPVKFVCGAPSGEQIERHAIMPGVYATDININNPFDEDTKFRWKAVFVVPHETTDWTLVKLEPNEGEKIEGQDILEKLLPMLPPGTRPPEFWEGIVVIESIRRLDVSVVYTSDLILPEQKEKQEILFRIVSDPFKVLGIIEDGEGLTPFPPPIDVYKSEEFEIPETSWQWLPKPPPEGPKPPVDELTFLRWTLEVLDVDFEKVFQTYNKVVYEVKGVASTGTRELLLPAPELLVPYPNEGTLEDIIKEYDEDFVSIIEGYPAMVQTEFIKQEVVYRWVSEPIKVVLETEQYVFIFPWDIANDDDLDGIPDEDPPGGGDEDGDGQDGEDPPLPPGFEIEILDTDIAAGTGVGVGHSQDIEYIEPQYIKQKPDPSIW